MRSKRQGVKVRSSGLGRVRRAAGLLSWCGRPLVVWVLPLAGLVALCWGGLYLAREHVAKSPKYRVVAPKLSEPRPPWWETAFDDQINNACAFANGVTILDESLLAQIAAGYNRCPWVRNVQWVHKQFPNRIAANLTIRWPSAAVEVNTGRGVVYYLVGDDGVLLPKYYSTWPQKYLNVPYIVGARSGAPQPGEPWDDPAVTDAIEIVRVLKSDTMIARAVNITAVDVSNYNGRLDRTRGEFLVLAEQNCVIEWGRAPGTDRPGELPVAEKIAKFKRFLAAENPISNRTLDLRFAGRVVVSRRTDTNGDDT